MKKYSYISLAAIISMSFLAAPLSALTPFDESKRVNVDHNLNKDEQLEIDIQFKYTDSESKSKLVFPSKGKITASALNIRAYPWGDIIDVYPNGEEIEIIGELGDWYKVKFNGQICYVHGNWVSTSEKEGQTAPKYGLVSNSYGVDIHRTPSGDALTHFDVGEQIYILGEVGEWYKIEHDGNEAFVSKKYIDLVDTDLSNSDSDKQESNAEKLNFTGYVTASALNVRSGPWGNIDDVIYNGDKVNVIGKDGDWYLIEFDGETKYVYTDYISQSEPSESSESSEPSETSVVSNNNEIKDSGNAVAANDGSLQQNIVQQALELVGSTDFRGPEVRGGSVACAQVVSTALNNAGAITEDEMSNDCYYLRDNLLAKGWTEVDVPPYQEGDVIFWSTYDWDEDGIIDEDTHVGIILKEGNTYRAMNNSSSEKMPRIGDIDDFTVSRVLRKN